MADFDRVTMSDGDTVDDFAGRIAGLASKATSLGKSIEEIHMVKKFLQGLPQEKFIQIIASLEQVLDLKTTGFADIVGSIKAYEERIGRVTHKEDQVKLMWSNSNQNNRGGYGGSRGGGRSRGRGRGAGGRGRG